MTTTKTLWSAAIAPPLGAPPPNPRLLNPNRRAPGGQTPGVSDE